MGLPMERGQPAAERPASSALGDAGFDVGTGLRPSARTAAGWPLLAPGTTPSCCGTWPTSSAAPRVLRGHDETITAVTFSPDGRWLATGSTDNTARLWDLADPSAAPRILQGHASRVIAVAFSPDGRWLATGSYDNSASLWNVADPAAAPRILQGHTEQSLT